MSHTAELESWQGLYYKGDALVIPGIPDLKARILKEMHDANYAGHWVTTGLLSLYDACIGGLHWQHRYVSTCKAAYLYLYLLSVSRTSIYGQVLLESLCLCQSHLILGNGSLQIVLQICQRQKEVTLPYWLWLIGSLKWHT